MNLFKGQKILIVEDNLMSFKLAEVYFNRANLSVVHATDGLKALELYRSHDDIQLIIMDIQLPGLDGLQVTKRIREGDKEMPIIAATANAMDDDREACIEAGCDTYITKPINFPLLFEMISKYLD